MQYTGYGNDSRQTVEPSGSAAHLASGERYSSRCRFSCLLSNRLSNAGQRIYALALGYETSTTMMTYGTTPCWQRSWARTIRRASHDSGSVIRALAGKSTLNRLEPTPVGANEDSRYKKAPAVWHRRRRRSAQTT